MEWNGDPDQEQAKVVLGVFVTAAERATGKSFRGLESAPTALHSALRYVGGIVGADPEARKMALEHMISSGNTNFAAAFRGFLAALFSILEPALSMEKAAELSSSVQSGIEALSREAASATDRQLGEPVN